MSVPLTVNSPLANSMSASLASIRCAAIFLALVSILSSAFMMAAPPTEMEREP
ncbi:hypothetical protein FQZ97_1278020 [compost metagenome]